GQRIFECALSIGTQSAQSIRASGTSAASTGRTRERTRPMLQKRQKVLAKAPSTRDPKRTWAGSSDGFPVAERHQPRLLARRRGDRVRVGILLLRRSTISLCQRLGGLSEVFNEKLCSRAQGSFFQRHDASRSSGHSEFHGQDLELGKRCA